MVWTFSAIQLDIERNARLKAKPAVDTGFKSAGLDVPGRRRAHCRARGRTLSEA